MSNSASIEIVKIKNEKTGRTWKELRIFDDYDLGTMFLDEDCTLNPNNDLEILKYCIKYGSDYNEDITNVLDFVEENCNGIYINDEYYNWDKIESCFNKIST